MRTRWIDQSNPAPITQRRGVHLLGPLVGVVAVCSISCAPPPARETLPPIEPTTAEEAMAPPTTSPIVMAIVTEHVEHCVELVQFGAFTGDADFVEWWDEVNRDPDQLQASCQRLATEDPWALADLAEQWQEVRDALDERQRGHDPVIAAGRGPG